MVRALSVALALLLTGLALAACGGDEEEPPAGTAAGEPTTATAPDGTSAGGNGTGQGVADPDPKGGEGSGADEGAADPGREGQPAPLATDPGSIRGARVTATGAVQTVPPSEAAQEKAMENSYSSIKAFGEESEGGEATDITFALVQYLDARASGDWATACARIYSALRANLERGGRSCPETYGQLMSRTSAGARAEAAKLDVASVRRGEGNRAFVIYKTPDTLSADMPMYLDGGVWTVGALEAYVLTPGQATG